MIDESNGEKLEGAASGACPPPRDDGVPAGAGVVDIAGDEVSEDKKAIAAVLVAVDSVLKQAKVLSDELSKVNCGLGCGKIGAGKRQRRVVDELRALSLQIEHFAEEIDPVKCGGIELTLGRSDSIAKFFAFNFVHRPRFKLEELVKRPFMGSGVYGIYYKGTGEAAYAPLSGSESPIYVGKADPDAPYAETIHAQGQVLFERVKEHLKSIKGGSLSPGDFEFRYAVVQSGMQSAVEDFLIHLFRPIWNKEMKVCFGIGKHGDSAKTRGNRRSPWDTMHPGRAWATLTASDQMKRSVIIGKIGAHLVKHPPFKTLEDVQARLLSAE